MLLIFFFLYKSNVSVTGMNSACPVHEWSGPLFGETVMFKMTSVCGHVMTLDFNSKFNNWDKVDPVIKKNYIIGANV